jgi:histidinol-phosphatase (PHP family)
MHPNKPILEEMHQRNIPVVIGADAHKPERVAANFEDALNLLQDVGYTHTNIFLNHKRHPIEINVARRSLQT